MRIWIDISNSPHVNFFLGFIRELSGQHEFVITTRPLANTIELLNLHEIPHHIVGRHYGKNIFKKIVGFAIRLFELRKFIRSYEVDVAICHSSYYLPVCARSAGIPSIYLNDNEHAAGNKVGFLFANKIMVPEFFSAESLAAQWASTRKVTRYPGVKEGIYLWEEGGQEPMSSDSAQDVAISKKLIIIRPEPWYAQYYKGQSNFLDSLIHDLSMDYQIMLLPRGAEQSAYYRASKFTGVKIPDTPITIGEFRKKCDIFLGAGGTMTREAAVLGIPTISIYQDELLAVDKFLVKQGVMVHNPRADKAFIDNFVAKAKKGEPKTELLRKGREAYELIKHSLLTLPESR